MLHHVIIGEGRPVLIFHGVTLDHRHMVETMEPVFAGQTGWQRIYVDLPGHGQNGPDRAIRSQDDLLAAVLDHADRHFPGQRFLLVGESRGSFIAQGFAHLRPDQVDGMLLIVPGGAPSAPPERLPKQVTLRPDAVLRTTIPAERRAKFDWLVVQTPDIVEETRRTKWAATPLHDAAMAARVMERFDFEFDLNDQDVVFDRPCLIVSGRQDGVSGYLDAFDSLPKYPRASLAVLDTAGHAVVWERPGVFMALARDWLERVEYDLENRPEA